MRFYNFILVPLNVDKNSIRELDVFDHYGAKTSQLAPLTPIIYKYNVWSRENKDVAFREVQGELRVPFRPNGGFSRRVYIKVAPRFPLRQSIKEKAFKRLFKTWRAREDERIRLNAETSVRPFIQSGLNEDFALIKLANQFTRHGKQMRIRLIIRHALQLLKLITRQRAMMKLLINNLMIFLTTMRKRYLSKRRKRTRHIVFRESLNARQAVVRSIRFVVTAMGKQQKSNQSTLLASMVREFYRLVTTPRKSNTFKELQTYMGEIAALRTFKPYFKKGKQRRGFISFKKLRKTSLNLKRKRLSRRLNKKGGDKKSVRAVEPRRRWLKWIRHYRPPLKYRYQEYSRSSNKRSVRNSPFSRAVKQ